MSIRGRLSRLERKAEIELRHNTPAIGQTSRYATDVEARRAKIAEVTLNGPRPQAARARMHPQTRRVIDLCERYINACQRRREQGR